ncbi:MAG: EamA family transporter [Proteobacteria bacterium]|nr:EamA family transporter [Pseudomonadota bacterium]
MPILALSSLRFERGYSLGLNVPVLMAFAYQCSVVAFFSYLLWFWMIYRFSVSRFTAFTFLAPYFGVIFSELILDEPLPLMLWAARPCRPRHQSSEPSRKAYREA